jgi:hypothetical protein
MAYAIIGGVVCTVAEAKADKEANDQADFNYTRKFD